MTSETVLAGTWLEMNPWPLPKLHSEAPARGQARFEASHCELAEFFRLFLYARQQVRRVNGRFDVGRPAVLLGSDRFPGVVKDDHGGPEVCQSPEVAHERARLGGGLLRARVKLDQRVVDDDSLMFPGELDHEWMIWPLGR